MERCPRIIGLLIYCEIADLIKKVNIDRRRSVMIMILSSRTAICKSVVGVKLAGVNSKLILLDF